MYNHSKKSCFIPKYTNAKGMEFQGKTQSVQNISCPKPDFACKLIHFYLNLLTIPNLHF